VGGIIIIVPISAFSAHPHAMVVRPQPSALVASIISITTIILAQLHAHLAILQILEMCVQLVRAFVRLVQGPMFIVLHAPLASIFPPGWLPAVILAFVVHHINLLIVQPVLV
jgi:hypothetical protein